MKKIESDNADEGIVDELQSEYRFDYNKAKPNRFAAQLQTSDVVVVLDSDVSEVFTSSESVNEVLRALIKAMPARVQGSES